MGITGGIGSGKSTVAGLFSERGAHVIDTDVIAHELTRAGSEAMQQIKQRFGTHYIAEQGEMDRARMRELVFSDLVAKRDLERILHPPIERDVRRRLKHLDMGYAMIVVPLLLETGAYSDLIKRVLVVDCDEEIQVARTIERSRIDQTQVRAIMRAQVSRADRLRAADDVIDNTGELHQLNHQVEMLDHRYRTMTRAV
ncbi:MAG: dephospho-CoA kinase [Betaproteobacteria bacterium]